MLSICRYDIPNWNIMILLLFISENFVNRLHCFHGGYVVELKNMIKDL